MFGNWRVAMRSLVAYTGGTHAYIFVRNIYMYRFRSVEVAVVVAEVGGVVSESKTIHRTDEKTCALRK